MLCKAESKSSVLWILVKFSNHILQTEKISVLYWTSGAGRLPAITVHLVSKMIIVEQSAEL